MTDGFRSSFLGEPDGFAARLAARAAVLPLLRELARVYSVKRWDSRGFERAFLHGAMREWRRSEITRVEDGWRINSRSCPVREEATLDPRVCQLCRNVQGLVADAATDGRVKGIEFPFLVTRGDGRCVAVIKTSKGPA